MERADNRLVLWSVLLVAGVFMLALLVVSNVADLLPGATRDAAN